MWCRYGHSQDGLLVCGGYGSALEHEADINCEVFRPDTGTWGLTGDTLLESRS